MPREREIRQSRLPWYSASVDSTYLTGKRVFIFGDGTHAVGSGTNLPMTSLAFKWWASAPTAGRWLAPCERQPKPLGLEALISDDYLAVEAAMAAAAPELVLGTQMERHSAKRLGIPCAVISTPMHVQDVPARIQPSNGLGRRQRDLRQLGAPLDDGVRGASHRHVPPRL